MIRVSRAAITIGLLLGFAAGQDKAYERTVHDSPADVRKVLQQMQPAMAGRLPVLDGFVIPGDHPLSQYQRGYYQASAQFDTNPQGETVVRLSVKITAWYSDPENSHAAYQMLASNGRIEEDILDRLFEKLAALKLTPAGEVEANSRAKTSPANDETHLVTAPTPQSQFPRLSSTFAQRLGGSENVARESTAQKSANVRNYRLESELKQLQEVLNNQAHPRNLVAVKKSGTPVVPNPSLNAKPMFLATAHDEFEMLNFTQDWVHVQISGLSRGWIWRNALEMPDDVPDTQAESALGTAANFFHLLREETALFPGDWEPLRGKVVKLVSVQESNDKGALPDMKLEFAKSLLEKHYADIAATNSANLYGIVMIFDSADGGMIAVPQAVLAKWKSGELSDAALWHASFFDPPETFVTSTSSTR